MQETYIATVSVYVIGPNFEVAREIERRLREAPQIQLMRLPNRETFDPVTPVDETKANKQDVWVRGVGDQAQQAGDHRARVSPQHSRRAHIA